MALPRLQCPKAAGPTRERKKKKRPAAASSNLNSFALATFVSDILGNEKDGISAALRAGTHYGIRRVDVSPQEYRLTSITSIAPSSSGSCLFGLAHFGL